MSSSKACLRILCLHGYRQNADAFRGKTGSMRKLLKKHVELVYITAPNKVKPLEESGDEDQRGWWFSRSDETFNAREEGDVDMGFEESLMCIAEAVKEQGPFDGILGFSQGAAMVALVLAKMEQGDSRFQFNFAIIVAGFRSRNVMHDEFYVKPISCPSFHVFGDTDKVIPKDMSEELLRYFEKPVILTHSGGHYVPATSAQKAAYMDFLYAQQQKNGGDT